MADNSNPIASLYPQPTANPLANPAAVFDLVNRANALDTFQARKDVGNALAGSIGADGRVDQNAFMKTLKGTPNLGLAPDTINGLLEAHGRMLNNGTAAYDLAAKQDAGLMSALGAAADDNGGAPDIRSITSRMVTLGRLTGLPPEMIYSRLSTLPEDPQQLRQVLLNYRNQSIGSGGVSNRGAGPASPEGAPTTASVGALNQGGAVPTELSPLVKADQSAFIGDQQAGAAKMAALRPLMKALPLVQQLSNTDFGPGSAELAKIKSGLQFAGIIALDSAAGTATALRQEAAKYLLNYAKGPGEGRSDQSVYTSLAANPNLEHMVQPANLALIKNQIGQDLIDSMMASTFERENPNAAARQGYLKFKGGYQQSIDPRAVSFGFMSPAERADVIKSIGGKEALDPKNFDPKTGLPKNPAAAKFYQSMMRAKAAGFFTPTSPTNGQ